MPKEFTYPIVRLATEKEYDRIWEIWMQPHVIQYMSFPWTEKETFKAHYEKLKKESDIYVMVDLIEGQETVVAVRRIKFLKGPYAHIAEYCSMGVHQDFLGRGYAGKFYDAFFEIAKNHGVERIQLTQSSGNDTAFGMSDRRGFETEVRVGEWLYRSDEQKTGQYHLSERFIYQLIDPSLKEKVVNSNLKFEPVIPSGKKVNHKKYSTQKNGEKYSFYDENNRLIGECEVELGKTVLSHIAFISIVSIQDQSKMEDCLKELAMELKKNGIKKMEIFTIDPMVVKFLQSMGFHYRGERVASYYDGKNYYNEIAADFSFFDIQDAKLLLNTLDLGSYEKTRINERLDECDKKIHSMTSAQEIDEYTAICYKNLAFQMIRDTQGKYPVYTASDAPWEKLINELPTRLQSSFKDLYKQIATEEAQAFLGRSSKNIPPSNPKFTK